MLSLMHSIYTVLMFVIFIGVCFWAYSGKRHKEFEEAANLPFADEHLDHTDHKGDKS